eukprot:Sspe_Gene.119517::Locus_115640_Transcript_1_2_Confidence_0.750_Length_674::g.119517::m.119517
MAMGRCAILAVLLAILVGALGETHPKFEKLNVEVDWKPYMRCDACRIFAEEISHYMNESDLQPPGTFKLKAERWDWVIQEAMKAAGKDFAFVVHNPNSQGSNRGAFLRISLLRDLNAGNEEVEKNLDTLQRDPMPGLVDFISEIVEYHEETMHTLMRKGKSGVREVFRAICLNKNTDMKVICTPHPRDTSDDEL